MPATLQTVIDLARATINDDDKVRWPDDECLGYAQNGLDAIYELRPDLFIGQFPFDSSVLTLVSTLPIEDRYRRQVADYIVMRCETKDDESVVNERAALAYKFFETRLVG
jgi:hypothetical protein